MTNSFNLNGKVIIVTGAAGLMGVQHCEAILSQNGIPILLDLDLRRLQKLKLKIDKKFATDVQIFAVDITSETEIESCCRSLVKKFNNIHGLINNAANNPKVENPKHSFSNELPSFSLEIWEKDIAVGLTGAFLCTKHFGNLISQNKNGGSIINISSDLGLIGPKQSLYSKKNFKPVSYSVVKSGIIGLTRYTSTYWAEKNVRCNALCPGGIENNQPAVFLQKISKEIPLGRLAKKNEYQGAIIWMLSDASSYLNGAIIPVDGGRTAW
jgi:NAD(P)-dependent dehydrogenase (short-subunit alcohol dehydrogenase family)|tara:strand:+ start:423 stop:1226 length:804 start_codon:yes stop_codon:yes gene_type:complete